MNKSRVVVILSIFTIAFASIGFISMKFYSSSIPVHFRLSPPVYSSSSVRQELAHHDSIEGRLTQSKNIWNRAMEKRHQIELQIKNNFKIFDANQPWDRTKEFFFWDLFYPSFDCPHLVERIGNVDGGGKWICGVEHLSTNCNNATIIVYSFGVNGDVTFEEELLARTNNFHVYMFDHTIDILGRYGYLQNKYPGRVFMVRKGLGAKIDTGSLKTLSSHMEKFGHTFVDILKMDIEWQEWKVIESFKTEFPSGNLPFGQLSLEFHLQGGSYNIQPTIDLVKSLENMHLRPFRMEFNIGGMMREHIPQFCEYSYINISVNISSCLLHSFM